MNVLICLHFNNTHTHREDKVVDIWEEWAELVLEQANSKYFHISYTCDIYDTCIMDAYYILIRMHACKTFEYISFWCLYLNSDVYWNWFSFWCMSLISGSNVGISILLHEIYEIWIRSLLVLNRIVVIERNCWMYLIFIGIEWNYWMYIYKYIWMCTCYINVHVHAILDS